MSLFSRISKKILENEIYVDVGLASIIVPFPDTVTIPTTWFRFVSKTDLLRLGENPPYYPDFIGMLTKIRNCTKHDGEEFFLLILADERYMTYSYRSLILHEYFYWF
uniref:Uncharacterized protein n=1 Tax=Lactuca sativa TaxID=4236 RepID=A0A9R1XS37_LACSA|nr:hypothetical protein LSAT_V11C200052020 [Lactuca sativa]